MSMNEDRERALFARRARSLPEPRLDFSEVLARIDAEQAVATAVEVPPPAVAGWAHEARRFALALAAVAAGIACFTGAWRTGRRPAPPSIATEGAVCPMPPRASFGDAPISREPAGASEPVTESASEAVRPEIAESPRCSEGLSVASCRPDVTCCAGGP